MENQTGIDRIPPCNIDAEEAVLGAALISPESAKIVCEEIDEEFFYSASNRLIHSALKELLGNGKPAELIILTDHLRQRNKLESVGGAAYLSRLFGNSPITSNLRAHISILKDKASRRALIQECQAALQNSYGEEETIDILARLHQRTAQLASEYTERDYLTAGDLARIVGNDIKDRIANGISCSGLSTGFDDLDLLIGGFDGGQLITLGGATGMGKTTFLLDLTNRMVIENKCHAAYFSIEMTAKEIGQRLLPKIANVDAMTIRNLSLSEEDLSRIKGAISILQEAPLFLYDTPNMKLSQLSARARRLAAREEIAIIFLDYIQLLRNPVKGQSRFEEVASIALGLKALARELNIPIIAGAQINRDYKMRADRRPMVDDIRESAQVGHDSDTVLFVHREGYFDESADNSAELIVRKCRSGRIGKVKLEWDERTVSFRET